MHISIPSYHIHFHTNCTPAIDFFFTQQTEGLGIKDHRESITQSRVVAKGDG